MGTGKQGTQRRADRLSEADGKVAGPAARLRWERGAIRRGVERLARVRVRTDQARVLLFAPPLVGGGGAQQARTFRSLLAAGCDLFSFCYVGHGRSTGRFSPEASLDDTAAALEMAAEAAAREGLPLRGVAACYAAIPLLHAAARLGEPLGRIALVNAILDIAPGEAVRSFLRYYAEIRRAGDPLPRLDEALRRYVDFMFPGVVKDRFGFGALQRRRTRLMKTLRDALASSPLAGVRLERTPALCLYGREDRILRVFAEDAGPAYEESVRRVLPGVRFARLAGDHFLSGPDARSAARVLLLEFLAPPASIPSAPSESGFPGTNPPESPSEIGERRPGTVRPPFAASVENSTGPHQSLTFRE